MVRFYIVRHGETVYNVTEQVQGWRDSPLTERGMCQAKEVGRQLADIPFTCALCGGAGRQAATAELILKDNNGPVPALGVDAAFRETGFGSFEEMPIRAFLQAMGSVCGINVVSFEQLMERFTFTQITDLAAAADPEGWAENSAAAGTRFIDGMRRAAVKYENKNKRSGHNVLIVSSGAVMELVAEKLAGMGDEKLIFDNGSLLRADYEDGTFFLPKV